MQGHESDVIILDWVVGSGDNLGFLADDRRANVALTRARTNMIVFYPESSGDGARKRKQTTPEVVAHTAYLVKRHRTIEMNGGVEPFSEEEQDQADEYNGQVGDGDGWGWGGPIPPDYPLEEAEDEVDQERAWLYTLHDHLC
jgi:hypothetical protein